jgi:dipeptidyl aminopeptidase/acylaminoacyl peptidase
MTHRSAVLFGRVSRAALTALSAAALVGVGLPAVAQTSAPPAAFTIQQVTSYPFPTELTTASTGSRIAWVFDERGVRNVYAAEAPGFEPRKLTDYASDDGQELTNVSISADGKYLVYVRGGDHDANWAAEGGLAPDPTSSPVQPHIEIWAVSFGGGAPKLLAQGDAPVISPKSDRVAYESNGQIFIVPIDGSAAGKRLFFSRGTSHSPEWSPDGSRLAFVSNRGDHTFIGIFTADGEPILWLAPSTSRDLMPRWSPDGTRVAFVRLRGAGGAPDSLLALRPNPWQIWTADARTGEGRAIWKSPATLHGSYPTSEGQANLHWMSGGRIAFLADIDGWPHLYSISENGGAPLLLTPGRFMVEYVASSPDRTYLVYNANTGTSAEDIDRRHIFTVPVDRAQPVERTPGDGLEWAPNVTGDGSTIVFLGGSAKRPPLPVVMPATGGAPRLLAADHIPADFPTDQLVTPKMVVFRAADGTMVHGQLFERPGGAARKPAVVFVHGGPPRQMLLGWHYMDYYTNSYAMNQYLASDGYVVLAVNYRLGIGYGHDFHHPAHAGALGASEYQDVKAGALYLRSLGEVDPKRIGIWGGSYGGFLTALALGRNSDLFAAGVDLHGVHDFTTPESGAGRAFAAASQGARFNSPPDVQRALDVAWQSSPVSAVKTWKSPVLLIQGDDDRNVRFHQTVDLARRLDTQGVRFEELVLPDEIHGFLRYASWITADSATARFFDRVLGGAKATTAAAGR